MWEEGDFPFKDYCTKELLISIFVIDQAFFYLTPEIAFALRLSTSFRCEGKQIISNIEKAVNVYI
jgi:uncharacterized protein YlaN (UPF0358 family)